MRIVHTIGHGAVTETQFKDALTKYEINILVDVRSMPGSNRSPQFNKAELCESLYPDIEYLHIPQLGGRRNKATDEALEGRPRDTYWTNKSFANYADHTKTAEFAIGFNQLIQLVNDGRKPAIMCGEPSKYRCHRNLIADVIQATTDIAVRHIPYAQNMPGGDHLPSPWGKVIQTSKHNPHLQAPNTRKD